MPEKSEFTVRRNRQKKLSTDWLSIFVIAVLLLISPFIFSLVDSIRQPRNLNGEVVKLFEEDGAIWLRLIENASVHNEESFSQNIGAYFNPSNPKIVIDGITFKGAHKAHRVLFLEISRAKLVGINIYCEKLRPDFFGRYIAKCHTESGESLSELLLNQFRLTSLNDFDS